MGPNSKVQESKLYKLFSAETWCAVLYKDANQRDVVIQRQAFTGAEHQKPAVAVGLYFLGLVVQVVGSDNQAATKRTATPKPCRVE